MNIGGNNTEVDDDDDDWVEDWDRRRRMAVVQVLCCVVQAICLYHHHKQCDDDDDEDDDDEVVSCNSSKKRKRKEQKKWEKELRSIKAAIEDVAKAIREGNAIMERCRERVYSEGEVFAELEKIGVESHWLYSAYDFLVDDPARVRKFFGYPSAERKEFLLQMMYGPQDV